jgi:2-pyrone-4,6-dicarboxylate lactonase
VETFSKFRSDTRAPSKLPPPNSCDAQFHVYGDPERYPTRREAAYPPPADATIDAALQMQKILGIERGVIVQSTAHGTDHRIILDALAKAGPQYRGIAIVDETVSDKELQRLHDAGVRGARFNFWKQLNIAPTPDGFLRSLDRIKAYGWHAKIHSAGAEWLDIKDILTKVKIPAVIDHLGHPDLRLGLDQPAIRMLFDLLRNENWWVLISNADRVSSQQQLWDDVLPLARKLIAAAPDKAIWCTDWPHVQYRKPMPNDAELLEFLYRAAPDPEQQRKILVDNPAKLFGF